MVSGSFDAIKGAVRTAGLSVLRSIADLRTSVDATTDTNTTTTYDDDEPWFPDW